MKCRHYRPEPALSSFFSCRGHSPASAWRYRILLTDELTGLIELAHCSGSLSDPREAISRRSSSGSSRAYAAGGGARTLRTRTHSVPSRSLSSPSSVGTNIHPIRCWFLNGARARWLRPEKAAHDESSSAPGSPAPRMSEYASLELAVIRNISLRWRSRPEFVFLHLGT